MSPRSRKPASRHTAVAWRQLAPEVRRGVPWPIISLATAMASTLARGRVARQAGGQWCGERQPGDPEAGHRWRAADVEVFRRGAG